MYIAGLLCCFSLGVVLGLLLAVGIWLDCKSNADHVFDDVDPLDEWISQLVRQWVIPLRRRELARRVHEDIETITQEYLEEVRRTARR